jgi:outer membrane protein assembly factor BamA
MNKENSFCVLLKTAIRIIYIVAGLIITSCKVQYEHPRIKSVEINTISGTFNQYELESYIRQQPNKKILFFIPFHLTVHNMASHLKDRSAAKEARINKKIEKLKVKGKKIDNLKWERKKTRTVRSWLMETIGEAPVLLDTTKTEYTLRQMELYLKTTGHFNTKVTQEYKFFRNNRTVSVVYNVEGGTPYTIRNFQWTTDDQGIKSAIANIMDESLISQGIQYNEDVFDAERDRITTFLRNNGYYHFSKSFIVFEADTSLGIHQADLTMTIKSYMIKSPTNPDEFLTSKHPRSKVGKIWFNFDYRLDGSNIAVLDTVKIDYKPFKKDSIFKTFYFIYEKKMSFTPRTILRKCFIRTGDLVSVQNAMKTNNGLSSLGNFKYINIRFVETGIDSLGFTIMDAHIEMSRTKKQVVYAEIEGTNSSGNLGISGSVSYRNRNTFRGAEALSLKLRGAMEVQSITGEIQEDEENIINTLPFNTIELGAETELSLPRFLFPLADKYFTERNAPKSNISTGVFFQMRPDYTRYLGNFSLTYEWKETAQKLHQLTPIFINIVRIFPDSLFSAMIEQFSRPLQTSYKDHLIAGGRWSYTYATKSSTNSRKYMLLRANIETAGNVFRYFSSEFGGAMEGETFYLLGIRFAQYTRGDIDIRQYFNITENTSLVFRWFTGLGIPYGNIDVLPFEKRYSAGGSNDIRAWKFRSLGPGVYSDDSNFDKTGDLSLVMNIEYRFPIYDILQSALFVDAGNIWMIRDYEDYPGGTFQLNSFYKQIALGAGIGIRLNFGYFIFRLDAGVPLHDPALSEGERWLGIKDAPKRTNLNFGIGYPF